MKQSSIIILLTVLMSTVSSKAFAHDIAVENADGVTIYYVWKNDKTELAVSFEGSQSGIIDNEYQGHVIIPESVEYEGRTYSVTSIRESAFSLCNKLVSVIIPKSVTSIEGNAFNYCTSLISVVIPNSVISIGYNAFRKCESLKSVEIPRSVNFIGKGAFIDCSSLTSVNISDLEAWCMINFIDSSSNPLYYAHHLFMNDAEVKDMIIPSNVTSIGNFAFQGCTGITSVKIPDSVTTIGSKAFKDCTGLTSITIPSGVLTIGESAFAYTNIKEVAIESNEFVSTTQYLYRIFGTQVKTYKIGSQVKTIGSWAFAECRYLTSVELPALLTSIEGAAFLGCSKLEAISIPTTVTSIGGGAFRECSSLKSINLPNSITSIGSYAFLGCTNIEEIVIPNSVEVIEDGVFSGCTSLSSVTIPNSVTTIGSIFGESFKDCVSLKTLTLPGSVKKIYPSTFSGCIATETVMFLHNKDELDKLAWKATDTSDFKGPEETTLMFSDDVNATVDRSYFRYRPDAFSFWMVENPSCFEGINEEGYIEGHFVKLTIGNDPIWLPVNGKVDGDNYSLTGRASFTGYKSIRASLLDGSKEGSLDLTKVATHSDGSGDKYQITSIGFEAFRGMPITRIKLPETLKELGGSSFRETNLRKVVIPNSLTSIGGTVNRSSDQFRGCTKLNTVVLGKNIESIGEVVFSKCDSLEIFVSLPMTPPTLDHTSFIYWGTSETTFKGHPYGIIVHNDVLEEYQNAEYWKDLKYFQSFETTPIYVKVDTLSRKGSSARLLFYPVDAAHNYGDISNGEELVINGLEPRANMSGMKVNWKTKDGNFGTAILDIQTSAFTIETNEPKALNTTKARLIASADEYDDMTHYGFEWRRIDAPDLIASSKVAAPLYNGQIVGTLNNLNPDTYYKYRPFYTSDSGDTHYGEWIGLFTGDANVYFEPEVYTKDAADITKVSALLAGVWFEGTDDIEEKGFEYWTVSNNKTRAAGSDVKKIIVSGSGNTMTTTLEGLKSGATYGYRSYVKTTSGKTTNGEEKTFQTVLIGDVDGDGELTKADVDAIAMHIIGQTPKGFNKKMADVNEDGKINAVDIVMLINIIK